jgi:hypothetical protein
MNYYHHVFVATHGGHGSLNYGDTSVQGTREPRSKPQNRPYLLIPGSGGGAAPRGFKYGSHAPGYNPDGIVIIRLSTIILPP